MSQSIPERLKAAAQGPITAEKWEAFQDALEEIDTAEDRALLPALYECFRDGAAWLQPMAQLQHILEDFDEEASLLALVEKIPYLEEHAPRWLKTLWQRTLNSAPACARLQHEIFPLLPDISSVSGYLLGEPTLEVAARSLF